MYKTRRYLLIKILIIAGALIALLLSGCIGPRGWPSGVVEGDTLYVGTADGRVLALNPEGGSRFWQWKREESEDFNPFDCIGAGGAGQFGAGMIYGSPTVSNGVVYVASYNGMVFAIRADTRSEIWDYEADGSIISGVAVDDSALYVGDSEGNLHAIDLATGELKQGFPFKAEDKIWSRPLVQDGIVYFGSLDHNLYAISADSGDLKWKYETGGGIASTPLIIDGAVYFGGFDNKFYAIDASDGSEKWVFDEASNWYWTNAVYRDGIIYACSLDNNVYAINAANGEPASSWSGPFTTGDQIKSSPVIAGDVLVVASNEGIVYGIDLQNGEEKWSIDLEENTLAPLYASGTDVFINTQENKLYAINGELGQQNWYVTLVE